MSMIYKTLPHHMQDEVHLDQEIEIIFMLDINVNSLRQENIILINLKGKKVEPVTFTYNRKVLKVKPLNILNPDSHYQLQLIGRENGIKDITGRIMAETYELEFYTKNMVSVKPPTILKPKDLSIITKKPEYHLTKIEEALYYELQISMSNTFNNLVWPQNSEKVYLLEDETSVKLDISYKQAQYYVRARSVDCKGICSSWSKPISFYFDGEIDSNIQTSKKEEFRGMDDKEDVILQTFTRAVNQEQLKNLQEALWDSDNKFSPKLSVTEVFPKNKSVNNPLDSFQKVIIKFSEELDINTVNTASCYILVERT
ncbi:Ig-like domain-containing protein [Bacillus cereus]|uniref:Ig-like domain-containing protein n=1 Tax=Bacillus cereus group TaxID=86661 RepID=UPI001F5A8032|nr:Ig-like domain-containing protein [Bacillus thuringiensis]MCU5508153.1 Ig-like domain-containing protein [Bacillus cereus]MDA2417010.1 Ig-like domain-containing protein [Bacillus cereus]MDR4924567.1 Ig-like domain-containing protein [Bacillus thuringiensis]MED3584413.1 Ig-like domain-containing protein [Bacillus thuringiensis]HDR4861046.1 Ig-like domain-containing protein [Bacillus cereus]